MKINKTLLAGLLMMGLSSAAMAQEQGGKVENVFNPHWYIQVQPLGAQYTLGEGSFGDMMSYNLQVAGGYNFNKLVGARLAINAFQSKGEPDSCILTLRELYKVSPILQKQCLIQFVNLKLMVSLAKKLKMQSYLQIPKA